MPEPKTHRPAEKSDITDLLHAWSDQEPEALDKLTALVYEELRSIARKQFARESKGHTLQPTAIVNELFLHLRDRRRVQWDDRAQFFGFAARQMRRILVDHARRQKADKRGGGMPAVALEDLPFLADITPEELVRLDDALADLARFNPDGCRVVEMRFFAGMNYDEIAEVLGVSPSTVRNKWNVAKAWLHRELNPS